MSVKQSPATNGFYYTGQQGTYPATPVSETLINGFFTVDHQWTVKYWNKAAEKILRVPAKDIVGENLWKKFAGIIPIELYAVDRGTFQNHVPVHFREYWAEMGAWFDVITYHCDNTLSVSFKSSNHSNNENSTDPVHQLKVLTALYRFGTEITNDCLWEWNLQAKEIFWIDGGHKRVFGYDVENAIIPQNFWLQCIHPDDRARVCNRLKQFIANVSSLVWEEEYRFRSADGSYLYVHDRARILYDENKKASGMIGATQDITEKVLLEKKLAKERLTKQREITDAVLTAQENEREIIGTVLNENLNQLLVVIKWNVQMAKTDILKRDLCLQNSSKYLDHVIGEIRKMYKTLVIPNIQVIGLFENINNLIHELNKVYPVKFEFFNAGIDEEEDLDQNLQVDIFRIVQEQLNNIIKHAHATHATIHLTRGANEIILAISDNGIGHKKSKEINGVGIINITSRTELYGGRVSIVSKPGKGFELKVVIPFITADD
jgi:PAS domain S-box-containing protein